MRAIIIFSAIAFSFFSFAKAPNVEGSHANIKTFEQAFKSGRQVFGSIEQRMALFRVPGLSIAVIDNGKLDWAKGYGVKDQQTLEKVDINTQFSMGSISKVVAATISLKLVEQGTLSLDADVNNYLTRWRLPSNEFTGTQAVTLRNILSHTSGLSVKGFKNFTPRERIPTLEQTLLGEFPAKNKAVRLLAKPGSVVIYSGGAITLQELIIEEVTSKPFYQVAQSQLFEPLNMAFSTFKNPQTTNVAKAHDENGKVRNYSWELMPQAAASGLWSTPKDLAIFTIAIIDSYSGKNNLLLQQSTAKNMLTAVPPSKFGLGPMLSTSQLFYHAGSNDSYHSYMIINYVTGNGIIVSANGANARALVKEVVATKTRIENWEK